jgi:AraC-like DNA-binding protein
MEAGDLVIFPRELPHTMVSAVPLTGEQRHLDYREAKDEEGTGLLCGEVSLQYECGHYILDSLPPVFIVRSNEKNSWLKSLLGMFHIENMQAGPAFKAIIDRLTELLFTYSLRQFLVDHPDKVGMMALYAHPRLSRAIEKVHRQPEKEWTLDDMAREAAMSRTSFSETFKSVSGWTAGQYLTWWRMQTAWVLLNNGGNLAEVSGKVGYKSESAFSRAFQKMFRVTAGKVRKFGPKKPGVIESGAITE